MKKKDPRKFRFRLVGYCPNCNKFFRKQIRWHRRHCSYKELHLNFLFACQSCIEADDKYFHDKYFNVKEALANGYCRGSKNIT